VTGWAVERFVEPAADFHALVVPVPATRAVWVAEPTAPVLVLGSTQPRSVVVDPTIEVVQRRSGGGAVLVVPGDLLWIDVIVPFGDDLWDDDVGRATHWLGDAWADALHRMGVAGRVHTGPMVRTEWSHRICFAGVGPGEVLDPDGRKLVGISQRRTRGSARFQCAALLRWDPAVGPMVGVPVDAIADVATGIDVPRDELLAAFVRSLP
jgi:lipoate-protein ligase A